VRVTVQENMSGTGHVYLEDSGLPVLLVGAKLTRGNKEQIEIRDCVLSFGAKSFVFQFAIKKFKD